MSTSRRSQPARSDIHGGTLTGVSNPLIRLVSCSRFRDRTGCCCCGGSPRHRYSNIVFERGRRRQNKHHSTLLRQVCGIRLLRSSLGPSCDSFLGTYAGGAGIEKVAKYIQPRFMQMNRAQRRIHPRYVVSFVSPSCD